MRIDRRQLLGGLGGFAAALSFVGPARAAGLVRLGAPFEAVPTAERAFSSGVAALPDGGFLIGWNGQVGGSDKTLRGRVWNADGSARGGARDYVIPVNFGDQESYECAAPVVFDRSSLLFFYGGVFKNGEFQSRVNALVLSDAETRRGDPKPVSGEEPDATALSACKLSADRAVVSWNSGNTVGGETDVFWRVVGADGRPIGRARKVKRSTEADRTNANFAAVELPDGGAILLFGRPKDGLIGLEDRALYAQRLDADGAAVRKPLKIKRNIVFTGEPRRPRGVAAVGLPNGAWALLFYGSRAGEVSWIVFDADDRPGPRRDVLMDTQSVVFAYPPAAIAAEGGRMAILAPCTDFTGQNVEFDKLKAVLVTLTGARSGAPLEIASFRDPNDGFGYEAFIIGVARLKNGTFVAHWAGLRPRTELYLSACRFAIA